MDFAQGVANPCPNVSAGVGSHMFLALINTLMASQCALGPEGRYPADYGPSLKVEDEFDFIVVGAGSAGALVASRLSEVSDWSVLVLEAGGYPSALTEIPGLLFSIQGTDEDWQYVMEPSPTCCLGLKDQRCPCPRGKVLGGSSSINAMIYTRGNRRDFDRWREAGNTGWGYDQVRQHFKKFENVQFGEDQRGELDITQYSTDQPIRQIMIDAYAELGYQESQEDKPLGYTDTLMTISQGTRSNTGKAFLGKAKDRKNLRVVLNAQVSKLVFDESSKAVTGVQVKINDQILTLKATKEVILSAGAINSPQILMNSGVGPKKHLEDLGIHLVQNLQVGENFQDHFFLPLYANLNKPVLKPKTPLDTLDDLYQYFMHRQGPLGKIELTNFVAYLNTKNDSQFPNLQVLHAVHYPDDKYLLGEIIRGFRLPDEAGRLLVEHNKDHHSLLIGPILLNPKSRGKVLLRSADPFDKPLIFPNYLSDPHGDDLQVVLEGTKLLVKILEGGALAPYQPEIIDYGFPNCKDLAFKTDEYWECLARNLGSNLYHQVGTCKMGPAADPDAVVDPRLKVIGIKGVRVVDSSVMPTITSTNTNAPTIMIGERGAELIKEDWLEKHEEL